MTMKTIYSPFENPGNKYVDIIRRSLASSGIETVQLRTVLDPRKAAGIRVVNYNWLENKVNRKSLIACLANYAYAALFVGIMKLFRIRIIYTFHNRLQHNAAHPAVNRSFIRFMCRQADAIVILCEESRSVLREYLRDGDERKIRVISHPNYCGECGSFYKKWEPHGPGMKLLFAGAVRPYKNIATILAVAKRCGEAQMPVAFRICGKAESEAYADAIRREAEQCGNVELDLRFLPDEELYRKITESDMLIVPYDIASSLNSGTLYLAFSLGRTVICPEIGTVKEFPEGLIYSYSYRNAKEHEEELFETVRKAFQDHEKDPFSIGERGEKLRDIVIRECSEEKTGLALKALSLYVAGQKGMGPLKS